MSNFSSSQSQDSGAEEGGEIATPEPESQRATHLIDDATKTLISITALWVALRSGWSPNYTPSSSLEASRPVSKRSSGRNSWGRPEDLGIHSSSSEAADTKSQILKRSSMPVQPSIASSIRDQSLSPEPATQPDVLLSQPLNRADLDVRLAAARRSCSAGYRCKLEPLATGIQKESKNTS